MGIFLETARQLLQVNAAVLALFIFGPGLSPASQTSSGPASSCASPDDHYDKVALLHYLFLFAILVSCLLASKAYLAVAAADGESLQALEPAARRLTRITMLLAVAFSAAAAGLALGVYTYVLQIRYTVFTCMPGAIRGVVFGGDAVVALVSVYAYSSFVKAAMCGA